MLDRNVFLVLEKRVQLLATKLKTYKNSLFEMH
jgi:hypothetical protein